MAEHLSIPEFALRATARGDRGGWLVLVVPYGRTKQSAWRVKEEAESVGNNRVEHIEDPGDSVILADAVQTAGAGAVVIISGIEGFSDEEWRRIDGLRSRFIRPGETLLIMTRRACEAMARGAPNLASWIGGSIWEADLAGEILSAEEREARLALLREWSGLTDDDVIRRATSGTLPKEPEFVEWLVLLKRVDLLGR